MTFAAIVRVSLAQRVLVLAAALLVLGLGIDSGWRLPVDVLPDLTRPTVSVQIEAPGLAPEEIETQVTSPVEQGLAGLPGLVRLRSVSSPSLSLITLEFDWGVDLWRSRQLTSERLDLLRAQLPAGLQPRLGAQSSPMGEILLVALRPADGQALDAAELRDVAQWTLRPTVLSTSGVSEVVVIGGSVRQLEIRPDPARLDRLGLSLDQLRDAVRDFALDRGGGFADAGGQEMLIRLPGVKVQAQPEQLKALAIHWTGRGAIRLHQVADVVEGHAPLRGDAGLDGTSAVILAIQKQPGADTLSVTRDIEARLAALAPQLPGYSITTLFRQSDFIEQSIHNLGRVLLHAALIVALLMLTFLNSRRTAAITLISIPLSFAVTLLVLRLLGLSINTMTLGGLAIAAGELVDDAIIGVESIRRRLADARGPIDREIVRATVQVRSGLVTATLIIVLALAPLLVLGGMEGRLFLPLGVAYIVSILASLLVSITVTPALCRMAFINQRGHVAALAERGWFVSLQQAYCRVLRSTLSAIDRHTNSFSAMGLALLLLTPVLGAMLPRTFLPAFNEGTLTVNLILAPGTALAEASRLGQVAERQLLTIPEVTHVGRRTGRGERDEHAEGVHYSELELRLRASTRSRDAIVNDVRTKLRGLPGTLSIGQPISHRLDHLLSGVRAPFVVKVFGEESNSLRQLADTIRSRLIAHPGFIDVQIEALADVPQTRVTVDTPTAALYGVSPPRLTRMISQLTLGEHLSTIINGSSRYDLVLRLPPGLREPQALTDLPIETPGGTVPLRWLAHIEQTSGPNQIIHEQLRRRIAISAFNGGPDFAQSSDAAQRELEAMRLPMGYELRVEGQSAAQQQTQLRLGALGMLAVIVILALLYSRYRSTRLCLLILLSIPLAWIGGVIALWLSDTPLSVPAAIGFIALSGIAARNSILKISRFVHRPIAADLDAVIARSGERLGPVLMTASTAALALIPLLWSADAPGNEILYPVAVVIFGGLISGTFLDSFVTPALYWHTARHIR